MGPQVRHLGVNYVNRAILFSPRSGETSLDDLPEGREYAGLALSLALVVEKV